ncbi:MAG: hypothetical protein NC548_45330 [Lachnospiraceae bacterium]|nr:hypothetical protein [Lachnospiraceae bacterium]
MEINKVTLNGVEYAVSDSEARQVAAFLSTRINTLETATADIDKDMVQLRKDNQELRDELNERLSWRCFN